MLKILLAFLFFSVGISGSTLAQTDSLTAKSADSLLNIVLLETANELKQSRQRYISDSIRKAELETEINLLKTNDKRKRGELQEKIRQIEVADSLRTARQKSKVAEMRAISQGFAVSPFQDTLFFLYTKIGPFSPRERAARINKNIYALYKENTYDSSALKVVEGEATLDILYKDVPLMSIADMDALWKETSKAALASAYRNSINKAVLKERETNSLTNILIRVGEVVLVILGIWLLIHLLNRLFSYSHGYIQTRLQQRISSVKVKDYELLSGVRILQSALWIHKLTRIVTIGLAIYLALPLLFSIFPSTKPWGDMLIDWIVSPVRNILSSILSYLPNLFTILVIFITIRYVVKFVRFLANEIEDGKLVISGFHAEWAKPTFNIARFLLYIFMFIVIFPYLPGSDSDIFKGVSVFLGILLSLGSSSAISNAVAGLVITYMRPFKLGDRVKINDVTGDVVEKTLLVTRIRTTKNEEITLPNSSILSGHTTNYTSTSQEVGLIIYSTVTIGYDVPWKEVHQALIDAALRTELILKQPQPFVLQTSLDDNYVSYQVNAYIREVNRQARIYSNLHQHIQDVFNERSIEILSPHYRAVRDGNSTTIPANYLPENYEAPHFRVKQESHPAPAAEQVLMKKQR